MHPTPQFVDIAHYDANINFRALRKAGVVGVMLKATEGTTYTDPTYSKRYKDALTEFAPSRVWSYHMLTGEDAEAQMNHYLQVTMGHGKTRMLDWELITATQDIAVKAFHYLEAKQSASPMIYSFDVQMWSSQQTGHFTQCPCMVARLGIQPKSRFDLWQYAFGENGNGVIPGVQGSHDVSVYKTGDAHDLGAWFDKISA